MSRRRKGSRGPRRKPGPTRALWGWALAMLAYTVLVAGLRWWAEYQPDVATPARYVAMVGMLFCPITLGTILSEIGEHNATFKWALATFGAVIIGLVLPVTTPDLWGVHVLVTGLAVAFAIATVVMLARRAAAQTPDVSPTRR